jgi:hypothetical protein
MTPPHTPHHTHRTIHPSHTLSPRTFSISLDGFQHSRYGRPPVTSKRAHNDSRSLATCRSPGKARIDRLASALVTSDRIGRSPLQNALFRMLFSSPRYALYDLCSFSIVVKKAYSLKLMRYINPYAISITKFPLKRFSLQWSLSMILATAALVGDVI